jgi:hypothetical protein
MATFGWAYINCADSGSVTGAGQAAGPDGSVQFVTGSNATSGSSNFLFYTSSYIGYNSNTLVLTGTLIITGSLSASHFHIEDIATIDATGSTYFGNSSDDVHVRTGSLYVSNFIDGSGSTSFGNLNSHNHVHTGSLYVGSDTSISASLEVNITKQQVRIDGFRAGYVPIASNNNTSSATAYIYGISAAGDVNFRLHSATDGPTATSASVGAVYVIKDEVSGRTGAITVRASGSETIDGDATYQLSGSYPAVSLYSNGVNWFVF